MSYNRKSLAVRGKSQLSVNRKNVLEGVLRAYHTNSRCFRNKMDLLRVKLCIVKFDIIAIILLARTFNNWVSDNGPISDF